jgi:hypothetical protein
MTVENQIVAPERLAALFYENFPSDQVVLNVIADETIRQYPKLAAFIERVLASDTGTPGRAPFMKVLGDNLRGIGFTSPAGWEMDNLRTPENLAVVRGNASRWWRAVERTDLIREWSLHNAAQELGVEPDTLIGPDQVIYCARFHERYLVPLITGKSWFEDGWSDEFYTDEYWRGLATLSAINDWFDEKESYAFVQWAGQQENIRAIAEEGHARRTIDIATLSEAAGIGNLGPALSRGAL